MKNLHSVAKNTQHYLVSLVIFVVVMSAGVYQNRSYHALRAKEEQQHLANIVQAQALLIDKALSRALDATYVLAQEVRRTRGDVEDFESLAERLIASFGGITNLQLAPGAIVRRIHPLAGHEKAIGHNLLRDDKRRNAARTAVDTGLITLAGPFELIQGGVAVIARNPVFLETDGTQHFWGFASALILVDDLYAATDLPKLEKQGYISRLSHISPETNLEDRFPADPVPARFISHSVSFAVPNDMWTLTLSVRSLAPFSNEIIYYILWSGFGLLLATAAHHLLRRPALLAEIVRKRTEELECANQTLKELSETDPLTKISNRRAYEERIGAEIKAAKRSGQSLSLLMVDIDYFKAFNDHYGHSAGDMALRRVAEEINETLPRSTDFSARYGGEEFVVVLPSTESEGAYHVAQRICSHVKSLGISHDFSNGIGVVTVSIGVASLSEVSLSEAELLKQADSALYTAKKSGRNRCVVFDSTQHSLEGT
ncbi:MAG: diguanylate cyclase [Pseudomonadota bacterium]